MPVRPARSVFASSGGWHKRLFCCSFLRLPADRRHESLDSSWNASPTTPSPELFAVRGKKMTYCWPGNEAQSERAPEGTGAMTYRVLGASSRFLRVARFVTSISSKSLKVLDHCPRAEGFAPRPLDNE